MTQSEAVPWESVGSSNIQAVAYFPSKRTLAVKFNNGGLYSYDAVDIEVYVDMVNSESVGRFLNQQIKNRYAYLKWFTDQELVEYLDF